MYNEIIQDIELLEDALYDMKARQVKEVEMLEEILYKLKSKYSKEIDEMLNSEFKEAI